MDDDERAPNLVEIRQVLERCVQRVFVQAHGDAALKLEVRLERGAVLGATEQDHGHPVGRMAQFADVVQERRRSTSAPERVLERRRLGAQLGPPRGEHREQATQSRLDLPVERSDEAVLVYVVGVLDPRVEHTEGARAIVEVAARCEGECETTRVRPSGAVPSDPVLGGGEDAVRVVLEGGEQIAQSPPILGPQDHAAEPKVFGFDRRPVGRRERNARKPSRTLDPQCHGSREPVLEILEEPDEGVAGDLGWRNRNAALPGDVANHQAEPVVPGPRARPFRDDARPAADPPQSERQFDSVPR